MTQSTDKTASSLHVLVVEDDAEIAAMLATALNRQGFETSLASDRKSTVRQFEKLIPDLVILDVMLNGDDGFRILGQIRERYDTPVIMLTAMSEPEDRVKGLTLGADDYVPKPFHTAELVARVRAVLKRTDQGVETPKHGTYCFEGWRLNTRTRQIHDPSGVYVLLTSGEFDVLRVLCQNAGKVLGRDRLVQISQNRMVEPYDRSVDTLVSRIRKKLAFQDGTSQMIRTVRNEGYLFTPDVEVITE